MENIKDTIKAKASAYLEQAIQDRRYLHQHPELSFKEENTAKYISEKLTAYGIEHQTGLAKTGIVGFIYGKNPEKKVIALRADMDALPLNELNSCAYKSENEGVMHACGHDAHMANLLGTARILNEIREHFEGTIKLFFQPSEESFPGGAKIMIEEGVLENPKVENVYGQHVYPELEAGKIGIKSGKYMASTDEVYLTVKGKGGHGALPNQNVDPVLIAAHIVVALQQIVSRHADPGMPTVLSFGRIIGEGRTNIIPDEVKLDGTIRTFDEQWRAEAHKRITKIAQGIAEGMGGSCEVFIDHGYPFVYNDEQTTAATRSAAVEFLGAENVVDIDYRMTAEDFAYFSHAVPSTFYRLGTRNEEKGITANLHNANFDIEEKSLETGMGFMAWLAFCNMTKL
ncbi:MAG: amidohydrolase [Bacteroidales bacterium]|nr:amidohydrolase [Bacteroidales bacterium]